MGLEAHACSLRVFVTLHVSGAVFFLAPFHLRDRAPPAINSPATATRLIKRERLVYICVE